MQIVGFLMRWLIYSCIKLVLSYTGSQSLRRGRKRKAAEDSKNLIVNFFQVDMCFFFFWGGGRARSSKLIKNDLSCFGYNRFTCNHCLVQKTKIYQRPV